jgi:hypothetical protein
MRLSLPSDSVCWTRLVCTVLLAVLTAAPAAAQSSGDGSFYSRYGIGMLETFSSPQSEALGQGAFALRTTNYNPSANPALWADPGVHPRNGLDPRQRDQRPVAIRRVRSPRRGIARSATD